jgi:hypothetical protein
MAILAMIPRSYQPPLCSESCDHRGVADLTDAAVRELRLFLVGTREDVMRWLPAPQWEAAWRSEAAREIGKAEAGPAGAWGKDTVRTVYAGAALYPRHDLAVYPGLGRRPYAGDHSVRGERNGTRRDGGRGSAVVAARAAYRGTAQGCPGSGWPAPREHIA